MNPERGVEIKLWDWLMNRSSSVVAIYFNSKNEVGSDMFTVRGECKKKPDLVIKFINRFTHKNNFMVVEVKDASNGGNVRKAADQLEEYMLNYIEGKSKYFLNEEEIKINHFAIATQFSEEGHLRKIEQTEFNESMRGKISLGNIIVPFFEFSGTKEIYRGMVHSFSKYRKDRKIGKNKLPSVGVLISDVILNFDREELKRQVGTKGMPIYQCVTFNNNKKRWSQCLMKI